MDYLKKQKGGLIPLDEGKYYRNRWLLDMFNRYEDYYRPEMNRLLRNQRFYWGVNFGQWPTYVVEKLRQQGRLPHTYNITAKKIDSKLGSYISNGFDMKYDTVSGKFSKWSMLLQDMSYSDKVNLNWDMSKIIALRDAFVMVGYERMFISDKYDSDFGNIAWEAVPPTHVYLSPSWKTPYAFDIEDYFEWGMFLVRELYDIFPNKREELKDWREREENTGINFGEYHGGVQRYRTTEEKWGDYHRVITFHHVVKEERNWPYDLINRCPFPETGYDTGSAKEREVHVQYIAEMGLQEGQYTVTSQKRRIKRTEVICPTLNNEMFLASGRDRIQTNNCNIYPIGNNFYGQFKGDVDDLHDINVDFNKGEMNIQDIQARTAKGAVILDLALTGGDPRKKAEIESRWNDPAARIWVDEGSTAELGNHGGIIEIKGTQPTSDMFRQTERRLDLADWFSAMPAAMDARSESAAESGKLYQSKVQVGLIGQKYGMEIYKNHELEKAQAYPLQAKITYAGFPRDFSKRDGKGAISINIPGIDMLGRNLVIDDIQKMPSMKVVLTPSTSGLNLRTELRSQYTETASKMLTDPQDRLLRLTMIKGIYLTQDLPEEVKEEVFKAIEILTKNEAMKQALIMYQSQAQMAQFGMMPQQYVDPNSQIDQSSIGQLDQNKVIQGTLQDNIPNGGEVNNATAG